MEFKKIEIIKSSGREFTVKVDELYCEHLMAEEALGAIASALFGEKPIFLKTADEWEKLEATWGEKHCGTVMEFGGAE